jgi:hypothetical protein
MGSYNHYQKRKNVVADINVGYCVITTNDSKVWTLAEGVDNAGAPFAIPSGATGARVEIEFTSTANEARVVTTSGYTPSVSLKKGEKISENGTVLILGKTSNTSFDPSELTNFKLAMKTGTTAKLQVTFIRYDA